MRVDEHQRARHQHEATADRRDQEHEGPVLAHQDLVVRHRKREQHQHALSAERGEVAPELLDPGWAELPLG